MCVCEPKSCRDILVTRYHQGPGNSCLSFSGCSSMYCLKCRRREPLAQHVLLPGEHPATLGARSRVRSYFYLCITEFIWAAASLALAEGWFSAVQPVGVRKAVVASSGAVVTVAAKGSSGMPGLSSLGSEHCYSPGLVLYGCSARKTWRQNGFPRTHNLSKKNFSLSEALSLSLGLFCVMGAHAGHSPPAQSPVLARLRKRVLRAVAVGTARLRCPAASASRPAWLCRGAAG